jgi:hypothetical protein
MVEALPKLSQAFNDMIDAITAGEKGTTTKLKMLSTKTTKFFITNSIAKAIHKMY